MGTWSPSDDQLDLRPVVDRHSRAIVLLNAQLWEGARREVDTDAINELRYEANAALSRVPLHEAHRGTQQGRR